MRTTYLPFALPDVGEAELEEIRESLLSGWLTTGPKTRQFEAAFAEAVGARYAVAVNSCTAAMHLALEAIGLGPGDEVITTPYTFAASAEVVRYFDARPVFVDVDPVTLNIDPARIKEAVTERTRAIIPVHVAGLPADLDPIHETGPSATRLRGQPGSRAGTALPALVDTGATLSRGTRGAGSPWEV